MLKVLDKHKIIGGGKGVNTLTYLENCDEDFNTGELVSGAVSIDGILQGYNYQNDSKCELYLDGSIPCNDLSGAKTPITTTITSATQGKFDKGLNCISNMYIKLGKDIVFEVGEDFTISFTLKRNSSDKANNRWLISAPVSSSYDNYFRVCLCSTSNRLDATIKNGTSISIPNLDSVIPPGVWTDLVICRKNGCIMFYINKQKMAELTYSGKVEIKQNTHFGNWCASQSIHFSNAILCNILITKRCIITDGEKAYSESTGGHRISPTIKAPNNLINAKCNWDGEGKITAYNIIKNKGIDKNTVLYLKGEDFTDSSLTPKTITNNGSTINDNGKVGKGIQFNANATNNYLSIKDGMQGVDLAKDFTFDWWEYSTGTSGSGAGIFTNRSISNTNYARGLLFGYNGTRIYIGNGTTTWNGFNSIVFKDKVNNEWVHWALVKQGNTYTSYRNGKKFWTGATSVVAGQTDGNNMVLGMWCSDTASGSKCGYNAIIDNFRISNVARWESDFTPPSNDYIEDIETIVPLNKNETIKELPSTFQLKQELEGEETISNVQLEMKYKLGKEYVVPEEDTEENNDLIIYDYGKFNTTTGVTSLNTKHYSYDNSTTSAMHTFNSDHIFCQGSYVTWKMAYTNAKIDFTEYSKAKALVDITLLRTSSVSAQYKSSLGLVVTDATASNISSNPNVNCLAAHSVNSPNTVSGNATYDQLTFEVDISNITDLHYLGFNLSSATHSGTASSMKIYKVWLEK